MIDPAKGESAWALGNQIINGYNGVLTAKAKKKPNHSIFWLCKLISYNEINWSYNFV